jgi:hypothetical protein
MYAVSDDGICLLAGAAGLGAAVTRHTRVMLPGDSWAPCEVASHCGMLYRVVADDANSILPDDWRRLHAKTGMRTFVALPVRLANSDAPVGVLVLASLQEQAFQHEQWGIMMDMVTTGRTTALQQLLLLL